MRTFAVLISAIFCAAAALATDARSVSMKAMYEAMEVGDIETVMRFESWAQGDGDFIFYGRHGFSLLHIAAEHGQPEIAARMLLEGLDVDLRQDVNWGGNTPLMVAADTGNAATARVLLKAGAEVNTVNRHGGTALIFAAIRNTPEMVDLLLDAGADPMPAARGRNVPRDERGFRALDFARKHNPELMASPAGQRLERLTEAGEGCDGATVEAGDTQLTIFAERILGDAKRWRDIAKLNGLGEAKRYRLGDCLKLPFLR